LKLKEELLKIEGVEIKNGKVNERFFYFSLSHMALLQENFLMKLESIRRG